MSKPETTWIEVVWGGELEIVPLSLNPQFNNDHVHEFPQWFFMETEIEKSLLDVALETGMVRSKTQGKRLPQLEGKVKPGWQRLKKGQRVLMIRGKS